MPESRLETKNLMGLIPYQEVTLKKGVHAVEKMFLVALQGLEGGVPTLAWSGAGGREGVLEVTSPEQCMEARQELSKRRAWPQKHALGQRQGPAAAETRTEKHPAAHECCWQPSFAGAGWGFKEGSVQR